MWQSGASQPCKTCESIRHTSTDNIVFSCVAAVNVFKTEGKKKKKQNTRQKTYMQKDNKDEELTGSRLNGNHRSEVQESYGLYGEKGR